MDGTGKMNHENIIEILYIMDREADKAVTFLIQSMAAILQDDSSPPALNNLWR